MILAFVCCYCGKDEEELGLPEGQTLFIWCDCEKKNHVICAPCICKFASPHCPTKVRTPKIVCCFCSSFEKIHLCKCDCEEVNHIICESCIPRFGCPLRCTATNAREESQRKEKEGNGNA